MTQQPRIGAIDPADLSDHQREISDRIIAGPRGRLDPPLAAWLHSPGLAERSEALGAFCRYGTSLPPRLSELAILVTGAHWRAGFEWAVHAPIAVRAGLSEAIVEAIRTGGAPDFTAADEAAVFRLSQELVETKEVSDATYEQSLAILGTRGVVDVVGILGYYGLISMTIKAFRLPLPDGAPDPFAL